MLTPNAASTLFATPHHHVYPPHTSSTASHMRDERVRSWTHLFPHPLRQALTVPAAGRLCNTCFSLLSGFEEPRPKKTDCWLSGVEPNWLPMMETMMIMACYSSPQARNLRGASWVSIRSAASWVSICCGASCLSMCSTPCSAKRKLFCYFTCFNLLWCLFGFTLLSRLWRVNLFWCF